MNHSSSTPQKISHFPNTSINSQPVSGSNSIPKIGSKSFGENQKQCCTPPVNRPGPPEAFVTPVVSMTTTPRPLPSRSGLSLGSPQMDLPGSTLANCSVSLPSATSSGDMQSEIDSLRQERLSITDDICELLSVYPPTQITSFFGLNAQDVQKKLALRKKLMRKEEELKRLLDDAASSSVPSKFSPKFSSSPMSLVPAVNSHPSLSPSIDTSSSVPSLFSPKLSSSPMSLVPTITCPSSSSPREIVDLCDSEDEDFLMGVNEEELLFPCPPEPDIYTTSAPRPTSDLTIGANLSNQSSSFPANLSKQSSFPDDSSSTFTRTHTFNPPFLSSGGGTGQYPTSGQQPTSTEQRSTSTGTSIANVSSIQAAKGYKAPRNDSSEFRDQYQHTREMYKIFNQIFGLKKFRPNQLEAVNAVVLGKDCFILMPTGGGKSLCYQLPALMLPGVTVVVSPLRSLIQDQVQKLTSLGIPASHLSGDLSLTEEREVYASLSLRDPSTKLLYVTPEKLSASNKLMSTLLALHNRQKLARFVIDEAHCISQWGHDFRPDYKKLNELRHKFPNTSMIALTATATPRVRTDILYQLNMHKSCKWFTQSFNRDNLTYVVVPKKPKKAIQDIIQLICTSFPGQSGIVYCLSRRDCELMAGDLCKGNIAALCYHAGLSNDERITVQQRWLHEDRCKVICATIAFGMGIDKPDVRFVIHHSLSKSVEGYYQEAGRAGRDAAPAQCVLFYNYSDMIRLRRLIKMEKRLYEQEKVHMDNLFRMVQYCENETDCRRVQLLEYFNESFDPNLCKNGSTPCNNCQSQVPYVSDDVTDLVRVIVKSIQRVEDQFTLNQCLDAIKGSASKSIANVKLSVLPFYNQGNFKTKHDLERLLHMLVMKDILFENVHIGNHDNTICYVNMGSKAQDVLSGKCTGIILRTRGQKGCSSTSSSAANTGKSSKEDKLKGECYRALCVLRLQVATTYKMNNPEYVVSTATLQAMIKYLPTSKEDLMGVEGYTEIRWSRFEGEKFLKIIQEYANKVDQLTVTSIPTSSVTSPFFHNQEQRRPAQKRPVVGTGKRKKVTKQGGPPLSKKQAVLPRQDLNSGDEFEHRRTVQLYPHPRN